MTEKKKLIVGFARLHDPGCWDTQQYDHVEIKFSDGNVTFMDDICVQYKNRDVSYYRSSFEIILDVVVEEEMQTYAHACWTEKIQFNRIGEFWNFVPILNMFPVETQSKALFGAEYICIILQKGYYCPELLAATTNPDKLWESLNNDPRANIIIND